MWLHIRKARTLPHDVLRHTYISMTVGAFSSVGDAALKAGNTVAVVRKHYMGLVTTEEADAFKRAGLLIEADDIAYENRKRADQGRSAVHWKPKCPPKNCLRHSFVTYHVALHRDAGKTALLVSHRNQDILFRHYLGIANRTDAERYFNIIPCRPRPQEL